MANTTSSDTGAKAVLTDFLSQYGLAALGDWAWNKMLHGESIDQIKLEMRDTPEYKARFPAMDTLAKSGRALTEAEYIGTENAYRSVMHAYGLPAGFYDSPDDFSRFLVGNVSPSELQGRVQAYQSAVLGDTETLHQLRTLYDTYGVDSSPVGDLLAHYLDPDKAAPLLQENLQAAQFASASSRAGFGQLTTQEAETYGSRLDTSSAAAQEGFSNLVRGRELMSALPGESADDISRSEQLGAAFGGDALAQDRLAKRARLRVAEGSGGGGFTETSRGISGVGSAQGA